YPFPESAVLALARVLRYARWRETPEGREVHFDDLDMTAARAAVRSGLERAQGGASEWLNAEETRTLLNAAGIAVAPVELARTAGQAQLAAEKVGYPVAVKLASATLTHKSDVGGVVLGLETEEQVRRAFADIGRRLDERGLRAQMDGVTVQPMITDGVEAIVGMTQDP